MGGNEWPSAARGLPGNDHARMFSPLKCSLLTESPPLKGLAAVAALLASTIVATTISAQAETSDRYSKGGAYAPFAEAIARANSSGELFRIRGSCASNCTMFLGLNNVCVERSARLLFHAGHARDDAKVINAVATQRMVSAYNSKLRQYVMSNGYMDKLSFSTISGARIIDEFGYKECPRK